MVSIPEDVFEKAERLAIELQMSRSQLYSRALQEFVARHVPDRLTEAMDRVVGEVGGEIDDFSRRAARRVLKQVEWRTPSVCSAAARLYELWSLPDNGGDG